MSLAEAVIVSTARTPIGRAGRATECRSMTWRRAASRGSEKDLTA
mgnify:CR=1 FL=1